MRGLFVLLLTLSACHTGYDPSWSRTVSPNGRQAFVLECSRTAWCIELAGDLCPRGYNVFWTGTDHVYDPQTQAAQNALASQAHAVPAYMGKDVRSLSIECSVPSTAPSEPPKITVTKNTPAAAQPRAVTTEPGF